MALHAAFLRGINLGNRRVRMDELRGLFAAFGLEDPATYRASGNVIFEHPGSDLPDLEGALEAHLEAELGYEVKTFIRPLTLLVEVAGRDVVARSRTEGLTPYVIFCRTEPGPGAIDSVRGLETADDRFRIRGREVYYLRRGRVSDSPVEPRHLEDAFGGTDWTRRKLTTVEGIVEKFGP